MQSIEYLKKRLEQHADNQAIIYDDQVFPYKDLIARIDQWKVKLKAHDIEPGAVVAITGDYSPTAISLVIALIFNRNIIVPLTRLAEPHFAEYFDISHTRYVIDLSEEDDYQVTKRDANPLENDILKGLIQGERPGLILFTSGSTGRPKGVAHDFDKLLGKFLHANKRFRTLCFLMFDHIAGIDTYFYSLFSGGTVIFPNSRDAGDVCRLIEKHKAEVLPTSPTFLNLLLLSGEYEKYDLSSLKIITFGSERMSEPLLKRLEEVFKGVRLVQKYGVTELGSPASKSKEKDSSWIRIDSERFRTKIVDGILYIKADTAMLGYLNAPSPFTDDGWFVTGDAVETDGDYIRILGRESEIINVGGEKVWPTEIEAIIQMMPEVEDVVVTGVENPITGQIIQATVKLNTDDDRSEFRKKMRAFCKEKLVPFQIPQKVVLTDRAFHGGRFKKMRMNF
ncbi:fatty acid--CoA ligase family protein [Desulfobacterales bacterium HSG2]|nr:fatty acid--CoA ligase family protein [Desulfobacterales bacterium HSG2]